MTKQTVTVPCKHCKTPVETDGLSKKPVLCPDCERAMYLTGGES